MDDQKYAAGCLLMAGPPFLAALVSAAIGCFAESVGTGLLALAVFEGLVLLWWVALLLRASKGGE